MGKFPEAFTTSIFVVDAHLLSTILRWEFIKERKHACDQEKKKENTILPTNKQKEKKHDLDKEKRK